MPTLTDGRVARKQAPCVGEVSRTQLCGQGGGLHVQMPLFVRVQMVRPHHRHPAPGPSNVQESIASELADHQLAFGPLSVVAGLATVVVHVSFVA